MRVRVKLLFVFWFLHIVKSLSPEDVGNIVEPYKSVCMWICQCVLSIFDFSHNNWHKSSSRVSNLCKSALNRNLIASLCLSSQYEACKANPVAKSHLTRPHAQPHLWHLRYSLDHMSYALKGKGRLCTRAPHTLILILFMDYKINNSCCMHVY